MSSLFTVSPSPHVRSAMTTRKIMFLVVIALVPAIVAATIVFGPVLCFWWYSVPCSAHSPNWSVRS